MWHYLRTPLLAIFAGLLGSLLLHRIVTDQNNPVQHTSMAFSLPEQVILSGWQFHQSTSLPPSNSDVTNWRMGRRYQYTVQQRPLTAEVRYFIHTGNADVRLWLHRHTKIPIDLTLKSSPGVGAYGLVTWQKTAHLTACIPPRGLSTVTSMEFQSNLYQANLYLQHLGGWLLGDSKSPLLDDRCIWAHLSTPYTTKNLPDTYIFLEQAWVHWRNWWIKHYPPVSL